MFGFEKVRVRVRNTTADIVESGTTVPIAQVMGGTLPGETQMPRLIAVARFHRNRCYRPDLSTERVQNFGSSAITQSFCVAADSRTQYQEISVSAPLNIASEADLPRVGSVEKVFDFENDPIPINATDLFIQVVYVGRLGLEPASIALGTLDVSEPTFVAYWNNTDFFYNGNALSSNPWIPSFPDQPGIRGYPVRGLTRGWICAGSPRKEVYRFELASAGGGMGFWPDAGFMRVAMLFPRPDSTGAGSIFFTSGAAEGTGFSRNPVPSSSSTTGHVRQANREFVTEATLSAPAAFCGVSTSVTERWCADPVQRRRGVIWGSAVSPLHLQVFALNTPIDVDTPPGLPPFTSSTIRSGGFLVFDRGLPFINCPAPNVNSLPGDF